jgi:hypothetical protein
MDKRPLVAGLAAFALGALYSPDVGEPPGEFFTWEEMTTTAHGANPLTREGASNIRALVANTLDPFRRWFGRAVSPTSGWRSARVNRKVGGAKGSQHMRGEATDFIVPGMTSEQLAVQFLRSGVPFDQLVWYATSNKPHLHVSYTSRYPLRRQVTYSPSPGKYVLNRRPAGGA